VVGMRMRPHGGFVMRFERTDRPSTGKGDR
jgi:hypothetical protein